MTININKYDKIVDKHIFTAYYVIRSNVKNNGRVMRKIMGKPDNIILEIENISKKCMAIEKELPDFLSPFFSYMHEFMQPKTRLAYLREIKGYLKYLAHSGKIGSTDTNGITETDFKKMDVTDANEYLDHCGEDSKGSIGHSAIMRKRAALSTFFRYMYSKNLIESDISAGLKHIKAPKKKETGGKRLSEFEVVRMLDSVIDGKLLSEKERQYWAKTKYRDYAILILFITYGLRVQELMRLNLSDFNFNKKEFIVYRRKGDETTFPLSEEVVLALENYLTNERRVREETPDHDKDALFLSLKGFRLSERQIREVSKKYTSMGMNSDRKKGYSPQKLRATVASTLIEKGNSINDVQELLHHESISTTKAYGNRRNTLNKDMFKDLRWNDNR